MNSLLSFLPAVVINGGSLVHSLLVLIVVGIILWLLIFLIGKSPIPEPFKTVLTFIVYAVGVLVLINWLLSLIGYEVFTI